MASIPKLDDPPHSVLRTIPGSPPGPRQPAAGLPVRPALPVRPRPLHRGGAAADRHRRSRAHLRVLVPGRLARAPRAPRRARRRGRRRHEPRLPGRVLMAGTGKAHLRDRRRRAAARRGPRGDVPGRAHRARRQRGVRASASTCCAARRSASSASRAAASRPPDGRSCSCPVRRAGSVSFEGRELTTLPTKVMREARTRMQMIFQDPISSLNPRRKVRDIVMEPLAIWKRGDSVGPVRGRRSHAGGGRHRPDPRRREPGPPVLRRAVPAHLDRPVAGPRSEPDHLRRAGVGARRQRAGPGAEPARGAQGASTA